MFVPSLVTMDFSMLTLLTALSARAAEDIPVATAVPVNDPDRKYTVSERVAQYGAIADARWQPLFEKAGVSYPPAEVAFVGLKDEDELMIYARSKRGAGAGANDWVWIRTMPVLAASGTAGPKLREGDFQVPEGLYRITLLNANSRYHLSLRVNYPNREDRQRAAREGRSNLGGDIMIHGNAVSIGCLAMGDEGAEDLFILAARVGIERTTVLLSPKDFRRDPTDVKALDHWPEWVPELHAEIRGELASYPLPPGLKPKPTEQKAESGEAPEAQNASESTIGTAATRAVDAGEPEAEGLASQAEAKP